MSPELRANILAYYADLNRPFATKKNQKAWRKTSLELDALRAAKVMQSARPKSSTRPSARS